MRKVYFLSFLVLFTATNFLHAQQFELSQEIEVPSELRRTNSRFPAFNADQFAQMAGDQAIYGGLDVAYIFEKNESGQWELTAELTGSDVSSGDGFGAKASITEDRAIVKSNTKAYIFEKKDGEWQEVAIISVSDKEDSGYSSSLVSAVGISGDYAMIGDQYDDGPNGDIPEAGVVYVYERTDDGSWVKKQELYASDASLENLFGRRISMDGNRAVIGMDARTSFYRIRYAGYIFEKDETGNWHETAVLEPYRAFEDNYEPRQAISGDYVAFGDVGYEFDGRQPGEVFIYEHTADGWESADQFNAPDKEKFDDFGIHLALDDKDLLVQTSGRGTYYYSRSADGQWEHKQILRDHYLLDISGDDAIAFGPGGSTVYFFNKTEESPIAVTGFSLVDADNNKVLRSIEEGDVIDLNEYENENFNILAHTEPENIGSVIMELQGRGYPNPSADLVERLSIKKTEKKAPYALFGDKDQNDFRNWQPEGTNMIYTLTAAPYNESSQPGGVGGKALAVNFEIKEKDYEENIDEPLPSSELLENDQVGHVKFVLVDADNNVPLQVINEWDEINLQQYPNKNFNIHIIPRERKHIGSVVVELELENSIFIRKIENSTPYAAFGDRRGDYRHWQPELGWYRLKAEIRNEHFGWGIWVNSKTVRFKIIDEPVVEQPAVAARSEGAGLSVYPNPAVSQVHAKVASASADQSYQLSVFNAFGEKVFHKSGKGSFDEMIDLNRQQPGLYMVVIESQRQREVKRLLLRK